MRALSKIVGAAGFLALLALLSCKTKAAPEKPLIVVSIYPYEILTRELVGNAADVVSIIPPSSSPHDWSPNPSNLNSLNKASLIITNGLGLEHSLDQVLTQHRSQLLVMSDLIGFKADSLLSADPEHGVDPHIWTSVKYLKQMVSALEPRLKQAFAGHADSISSAALRLQKELDGIDAGIKAESRNFKAPAIITYHNSFGYFMRDYGISHLASVQSSPGKEPTPRELGQLGNLIQANGIKAIFVEPQISQRSAEILAKEFDLKILILDPIGNSLGADSIGDFISSNWKIMKLGLEPGNLQK